MADLSGGESHTLWRLLALGRDHGYNRHTSFDPGLVGEDAALNLGACLIKQAKLAEARRLLLPLAESDRLGATVRANLELIDRLKTTGRNRARPG